MRILLSVPSVIILAASAWGQAVPSTEPSGTHVFPAGGRRGTVVPVRVGAECLPPGANFHVWGHGVTAPALLGPRAKPRGEPSPRRVPSDADNDVSINYPKEWESTIRIAADASLGVAAWRATCGWGGTRPRPFIVGDLPEFVETESNSTPAHAERVTMPVTVNGQISGERDVDYFIVRAETGDVVVCDVLVARIGSPLDPVIEVRGPHGQRISLQEVRVGGDPVLAFRAASAGDYLLSFANVSVRGGPECVYRATISTKPYVAFALPAGTKEREMFALTGGEGFRTWKEMLPTGFAVRWMDQSAAAQNTVDVVGRFLTIDADDQYTFSSKKDQAFTLHCQPYSAASLACPVVAIEEATGKPLARISAVESATHDCRLEWKAPTDGTFRLRVRDLQHGSRGGPEFVYRLSLRPARPAFTLTLAADYVNVLQGGRVELDLLIERTGGFTGPIDLEVRGLPDGVKLETPRVPENVVKFKLAFTATNDARPVNAELGVMGTASAMRGSPAVPMRVATVGGPDGVIASAGRTDKLWLTVQHKPIFKLTCNEAYQYAHRGTVYPYKLSVERLNGFEGEITVQIGDRQVQDLDGIDAVERVIPRGIKETAALVYLPETMNSNAQHHSRPYVQGYATFTDKWGRKQAMLALCDKRCMIRAMPLVAKLKAVVEQVTARPGQTVSCHLTLARTSHFAGPMDVELAEPISGVTLDATRIAAGESSVVATIRIDKNASIERGRELKFRGTGRLPGDVTVVSETAITLRSGD